EPWWAGFPHMDICRIICNDILHGLHKAFKDHTWTWVVNMIGKNEVDQRFRRIPKTHGYRSFPGGISKISQWSIKDARSIERYALAAAMGALPDRAIRALRAELDYIYSASWSRISETDLTTALDDNNDIFHANKNIFIEPGGGRVGKGGVLMTHFRIPKLHARHHFPQNIRDIGALLNCSAEITERYHIEIVKLAYLASNRKDVAIQLIHWLNRQEKVYQFDAYLAW
ncbi:hypothetical protein AURDEDRAFT_38423, partial [Auricularia subglabra TFB-10046 SS5]